MHKFDMNKVVKDFFDRLNTKLEYDEDIEVNSIDELVDKVNKYIEKEK